MSVELSVDQYRGKKNIVNKENGRKLGERGYLEDVVVASGQLVRSRSGMLTECRIVQAEATLSPGAAVKYSDNKYGTHVDAVADAEGRIDGIVDPDLPSSVVSGDTFLLITSGPVDAIAAGAISSQDVVGDGTGKVKAPDTVGGTEAPFAGRVLEDGSGKSSGDTIRIFLNA